MEGKEKRYDEFYLVKRQTTTDYYVIYVVTSKVEIRSN